MPGVTADAPPVRVRREVAETIGWSPAALRALETAGIVQIVEHPQSDRLRL